MNPIESKLKEKYSNIRFELYPNEKFKRIYLTGFIVPVALRGTGVGTEFMTDLVNLADEYGYKITLSPSNSYGGNVNRLKDFYQRFGFVFNKGKNRDFSHREDMYRDPKGGMNEEESASAGTSPSNSPAPERTKRGKANPTANTGTYDYGTVRGKANPIANTGTYEFDTNRGPANPIAEDKKNDRLQEAIISMKNLIKLLD